MTTANRPRLGGILAVFLLGFLPSNARAGTFPYWGLSFGTPAGASAQVGASFGGHVPDDAGEGFALGTGTVLEAMIGTRAGQFGVGKSVLILTEEKSVRVYADWKAVAIRTWDNPRAASAHATYLGVDGGLSVAFFRFTMGLSKRVEQKPRGANVLFSWGAGIQIRLGGNRKP